MSEGGSIRYPLFAGDRWVGYVAVPIEVGGVTQGTREAIIHLKPGQPVFTLPQTACAGCDAGNGQEFEVTVSLSSGLLPVGTLRCCRTCQPDLFA